MLKLTLAYEKGDWLATSSLCASLGIEETSLPGLYFDAIEWADRIFSNAD